MDPVAVMSLALQCAPTVHPATVAAIVAHESKGSVFAIGVNNGARLRRQPTELGEASRVAAALVRRGYSIDMGLGQINSRNMAWLGLDFRTAFDPCANLGASARVLTHNYRSALASNPNPQRALRIAFSLYNTGHPSRGFRNGYVRKIENSARWIATRLASARAATTISASASAPKSAMTTAEWNVFRVSTGGD